MVFRYCAQFYIVEKRTIANSSECEAGEKSLHPVEWHSSPFAHIHQQVPPGIPPSITTYVPMSINREITMSVSTKIKESAKIVDKLVVYVTLTTAMLDIQF